MQILFPDDHQVLSTRGITYQQAAIGPSEGLMTPHYPWEGHRTNLYGSVVKSERGYEMFYQCHFAVRIGYAVSPDGFHWERPLINPTDLSASADRIVQSGDSMGDGLQMTNLVAGYHMPSLLHEPDSDAPYKLFVFGEEGYRVLHSRSGTRFEEYPGNPVIPEMKYINEHTRKWWVSDVAPCFRDRAGYTAMVKTYEIDDQHRTLRCVGRSTSDNFRDWSEVETVWVPGEAEHAIARARGLEWADFYGLCPFPYGNGYLGLLWLFEIERELPQGTNKGKIEVFLAYSPDGICWRRLSDQALIPWDLNFGDEGGMVTTASAPVFEDDEIRIYYSDSNFEHGAGEKDLPLTREAPTWKIRCASIPRERLVGAYADEGEIRLQRMNFDGQRLRLNLDCRDGQVALDYHVGGEWVATQTIDPVDALDHFIQPAVSGDAELVIRLTRATLYALELGE